MTKRVAETVFYGSVVCQAQQKNGKTCTNGAYFKQGEAYLCGVHSSAKKHRVELPRDRDAKQRKVDALAAHHALVEEAAKQRDTPGIVQCHKMSMMREVPLRDTFLNVFPNNKHQNRADGFGCASLSPMRLGPVLHRQPGLPAALNIENYHQFNKTWPNEVDTDGNPLPAFYSSRANAYLDAVPHRHKYDAKTMTTLRTKVAGENRNQPLYSVHLTLDGEERRFSYVQSRFFYCKAYEALAKRTDDFRALQQMLAAGKNLLICGYDAYDVSLPLYDHYCDETRAFGHELVLYCLLTIDQSEQYPWNIYAAVHTDLYRNIAYMQ